MADQPRIVIAGLDVIASGTFTAATQQQPIELYPFSGSQYFIRLRFEEIEGKPSEATIVSLANNAGVEVKLTNFENVMGVATASPIYVANIAGFKIFLWVASRALGPSVRTVDFTIYRGEAANV